MCVINLLNQSTLAQIKIKQTKILTPQQTYPLNKADLLKVYYF